MSKDITEIELFTIKQYGDKLKPYDIDDFTDYK